MPLEIGTIPLAFIFALGFALIVSLIVILLAFISKLFSKSSAQKSPPIKKFSIVKVTTTGEQLNKLFMTTVMIFAFIIIGMLLMASFYFTDNSLAFSDLWPFILITVVLIFTAITTIDWNKLKSKRVVQKEMRRY